MFDRMIVIQQLGEPGYSLHILDVNSSYVHSSQT